MYKSMHPSSNKVQKCSRSRRPLMVDRISELPEDILAVILSFLTMKEAACTSILSHRWKTLWTFFIGSLEFDGLKVLQEIDFSRDYELLEPQRIKFVSWVNQILNAHKGATIDELRVRFDLDLSFGSDIDSWINFALQKRVQRLELFFELLLGMNWERCYNFPEQSLGNSNINCLTSLKLHYVGVTQEILEYLLSNCPHIESVCISASPRLLGLKILPTSLKLKCLEIVHCHHLKFLEISAINLKSLTYSGPQIELCLKNVPNLAALSFGGYYAKNIIQDKNFRRLSISLSQIAKLELDLAALMYGYFSRFPRFKNLKQLELLVKTTDSWSLLSCTSLLGACPILYRFSIQMEWLDEPHKVREIEEKSIKLKCLKVVELRWFRGSTTDVELATFLFTNALYLEKIKVDTRNPYCVGTPFEVLDNEKVIAKECATQLATSLSPRAELEVL